MKKWNILASVKDLRSLTIEKIRDILLQNRGIISEEQKDNFLKPKLESISIDSVGIDKDEIKKTFQRIKDAIQRKEQIIIYGDYDVDGITGTAIFWETLKKLGAIVLPYIPHRVEEGYGLSEKGIENILKQYPKTSLIITVDNGIVANKAVDYAFNKMIDVIITDHHVSDEEHQLPQKAFSILHTTQLCGAGISWLISNELFSFFGKKQEDQTYLGFAALATIADLVPLQGANRAIVFYGLQELHKTHRPGLIALFEKSGINQEDIGVYEVGHIIAPRLNATGRLESAMDSLRLLCTQDKKRADELAIKLNEINATRQKIMIDSVFHAKEIVETRSELKKMLIVAHDSYPEGIIGLIASKLVEEYHRPTIVIATGEKVSKGSVRSIQGFNIIQFLRQNSHFFVNVGGHPMAAGFTIATEKIELFQKTLEDLAHLNVTDDLLVDSLNIDCEIPFNLISSNLYAMLKSLKPYGMGNPQPIFLSRNVYIRDLKIIGKEGKHFRMLLQQDNKLIEAVAFNMVDILPKLQSDEYIDIVYSIDENTWNGNPRLQLKLKDIKKAS
jgi:single-stranded-DNA-specific exonuclease